MLWILIACASFKKTNEEEPTPEPEEEVVLVPPTLSITSPVRGEFINGAISVEGSVENGSSSISRLLLNQEEVDLDNGSFSFLVPGNPGINLLNFRSEAEDGERSVDSIGVYSSPFHPVGETVDSGIRLHVGQELLDDSDPDLDDLASIVELAIDQTDWAALLGNETIYLDEGFLGSAALTVKNLSYGDIDLQIQCGEQLTATVYVSEPVIELEGEYSLLISVGIDGTVSAESLVIEMILDAAIVDGLVEVIPIETTVELTDPEIDVFWDWIDGAIQYLFGGIEEQIEETIAVQAEISVTEISQEYLNTFSVDVELFAGVSLRATLSNLDMDDEGLRITADGLFYGPVVKDVSSEIGSAKIAEAPPDWPLSTRPFTAAISGDLANQLMFAAWSTGFFDDIEMDGLLIQGLAGDAIPPPIGPIEMLRLNLALPPSFHKPTVDGMTADLAIGEWQMDFFREDGEEIDYRVNLRSGVSAYVDDGRIHLELDSRPSKITLGVATITAPSYLDNGDLSALGRLMIPSLLGSVQNYLPSIGLPVIELGSITDSLQGEELEITSAQVSVTDGAWVLIEANLN